MKLLPPTTRRCSDCTYHCTVFLHVETPGVGGISNPYCDVCMLRRLAARMVEILAGDVKIRTGHIVPLCWCGEAINLHTGTSLHPYMRDAHAMMDEVLGGHAILRPDDRTWLQSYNVHHGLWRAAIYSGHGQQAYHEKQLDHYYKPHAATTAFRTV